MKRWMIIFLILGMVLGMGSFCVSEYLKEQRREDTVWQARLVLEQMRTDRTFSYLRLDSILYDNQQLKLVFLSRTNIPMDEMDEFAKDSLMRIELASLVSIARHDWDSVFRTLERAKVDLAVTYSNFRTKPLLVILSSELIAFSADERLIADGKSYFIRRKKEEVLAYAKGHFKEDPYLHVDSLSVECENVSLYLSYDDTKYRLSKSFLDTGYVNAHFTDPVGEMGSILDGVLTICAQNGYGFEFVYVGSKNNRVERCLVDAKKTKDLIRKKHNQLLMGGRETNQVKTTVISHR